MGMKAYGLWKPGKVVIKNINGQPVPKKMYSNGCAEDKHGRSYCGWLLHGHLFCPHACEAVLEEE